MLCGEERGQGDLGFQVVSGLNDAPRFRLVGLRPHGRLHLVADLLSFGLSPSVRTLQACVERVLDVATAVSPFEIAHMVVLLIAVDVVHLWQIVRIRQEVLSHQPIDSAVLWLTICQLYHCIQITARLLCQRQQSWSLAVGAHTSKVAHVILSVGSFDGSPFLFDCLSIHRCSLMSLRSFTFSFLFLPISL